FEEIKETLTSKEEKKVEYIELIYDLIFVYLIGRNSSFISLTEGGFISSEAFLTYVICTLVMIQIWNFTNFYINRYGSNGLQEHMLIFVNMFLLYFMGDATRTDWSSYYYFKYNIPWALIMINFLICYWLKYREYKDTKPWESLHIICNMILFGVEAAIILISLPIFSKTGLILSPLALVFGIIFLLATSKINNLVPVDFGHLSERAMLYIVFTFGEMIIAISGYFEGVVSFRSIYFALMGFLIVVGLFQSYELCYDHLIDRELITNGIGYMMIHLFLIFALSCITVALEFMREEEVALMPKTIFLTVSFVVYFVFLFLLGIYMKNRKKPGTRFIVKIVLILAAFSVLMIVFREKPYINIAVTVALIYGILGILVHAKNSTSGCHE
ncbi:MAG: low temperature requirement protein A, partial [Firmicutes bacterium]|nr:low temperature requirement protein A [Bacillota bacterium]